MQLPSPIAAYFDGENRHAIGAVAACFTEDAIVTDEGAAHAGRAAIAAWKRASAARYRVHITPLSIDPSHLVRAQVSGSFPGSPIELRFAFTLAGGQIAALEIKP